MKQISVDGHPNLYRDSFSGAIVNKNESEYESYLKSYKARQTQNQKINNIEQDLNNLKSEINEIKQLLVNLSSKL